MELPVQRLPQAAIALQRTADQCERLRVCAVIPAGTCMVPQHESGSLAPSRGARSPSRGRAMPPGDSPLNRSSAPPSTAPVACAWLELRFFLVRPPNFEGPSVEVPLFVPGQSPRLAGTAKPKGVFACQGLAGS